MPSLVLSMPVPAFSHCLHHLHTFGPPTPFLCHTLDICCFPPSWMVWLPLLPLPPSLHSVHLWLPPLPFSGVAVLPLPSFPHLPACPSPFPGTLLPSGYTTLLFYLTTTPHPMLFMYTFDSPHHILVPPPLFLPSACLPAGSRLPQVYLYTPCLWDPLL